MFWKNGVGAGKNLDKIKIVNVKVSLEFLKI